MSPPPIPESARASRQAYAKRALAACVEQGFTVAIEDQSTLDFLADVLSHSERSPSGVP